MEHQLKPAEWLLNYIANHKKFMARKYSFEIKTESGYTTLTMKPVKRAAKSEKQRLAA